MAMDTARTNKARSSDRAWQSVISDWQSLKGPKGDPSAISKSDITRISGLKELDNRVKTAVSTIKSARRSLFDFREAAAQKAEREFRTEIDGKRIISVEKPRPLLAKLFSIFEGVAFNVSNVRRAYNQAVPENVKQVVDAFGGKTFTRTDKTPSALLLASVPKGKEDKDLSINTLVKGVEALVSRLKDPKGRYAYTMNHEFRVIKGDNHIVLYRELNGVEQSIEMSFRRANKVDIFINGKPTPSGSLYNDDALKTAEAFLKGKKMNFKGPAEQRQRFKEYVVVKDVESLRAA
jgi:hypothetical protein